MFAANIGLMSLCFLTGSRSFGDVVRCKK